MSRNHINLILRTRLKRQKNTAGVLFNVPCSTNLTEEEIERVVKVLADKLDLQ